MKENLTNMGWLPDNMPRPNLFANEQITSKLVFGGQLWRRVQTCLMVGWLAERGPPFTGVSEMLGLKKITGGTFLLLCAISNPPSISLLAKTARHRQLGQSGSVFMFNKKCSCRNSFHFQNDT